MIGIHVLNSNKLMRGEERTIENENVITKVKRPRETYCGIRKYCQWSCKRHSDGAGMANAQIQA